MKPYIRNLLLLPALIAGLGLIPAGRVTAQTFTTLHSFNADDGAYPVGGLILSGNTLYGTAANGGGAGGPGAVFAVNADGTGFTNLHGLTASDGGFPYAGLVLSGSTLYGTTTGYGNFGSNGYGTVFKVNTNGAAFTILHSFAALSGSETNNDGARPWAGVIISGDTLYGTAHEGGSFRRGTVFKVKTDGTGFTKLHTFAGPSGSETNNDGADPQDGLVLSGNTLYGTTRSGGGPDSGTVFKMNTDGTGYTILHSFTYDDGANPSGLILSGNTLYGTTVYGSSAGVGTVFKMNTNGTGFTTLHTFTAIPFAPPAINSDGAYPEAGLILSGNTLYGTASEGGISGSGTVFAVNTDGTGFTILHGFTAPDPNTGTNSDGYFPYAELILSGNTLYGTTKYGGSSDYGTVFSLSLPPPQLTIIRSGANVILTWPTHVAGFDYTGFTLQSTTNLSPDAWSPIAHTATTNAGQISVTVPTTLGRKFFRLKSQ